jgi:hypothetical protein
MPKSILEQRGPWVGACWKEIDIDKGRALRDRVVLKRFPCAEEIQLGRHLVSSWRLWT